MTPAELVALYSSFTSEAVRLETRQYYEVPGDADRQRAYREGQPLPARPAKSATVQLIRDAVDAGKTFARVHIVDHPLSDYVHYELDAAYPENHAAGEQVWIVDRASHPGLAAAHRDFALFDRDTDHPSVVWYDYTPDGRLTGYTPGTPADLAACTSLLTLARTHALPYADFMTSEFRKSH
ncbi:DUF6879 family protein [Frankia gtarii]|uniref:DUF6879 family protein n=1 Tax=Frankia gtarii TaxID=2950102 RepID=UPI0021BF570D|nr:DUF6879 family protein [Frankia gtarii]